MISRGFLQREVKGINQAALLLGFFTLLSQLLALLRDRMFAHFIGPSPELDAYYAAFRIPDFIFISISSLVSITVLIPFILEKMNKDGGREEARKFLDGIFLSFLFVITFISLVIFIFMPAIVNFTAPGFDAILQAKVVMLSRIMLLSPILLGLSNLFGTVAQVFRKFFIYSLSPVFYNLGIIVGIGFFYPLFGLSGHAFGKLHNSFT